jgi:uncharacterized OsmC-like protein
MIGAARTGVLPDRRRCLPDRLWRNGGAARIGRESVVAARSSGVRVVRCRRLLERRANAATIRSSIGISVERVMSMQLLAEALQRVEAVMRRRPAAGIHDDPPATARWTGGTRVVAIHGNGTQVSTDMPTEIGGTGDCVTPGWLLRAGLAACAATSIVMAAAEQGVELTSLETFAGSRSDARGLFGMADEDGRPVRPGPGSIVLNVRIAAPGVDPVRLRELVELGCRRSPVPAVVRDGVPLDLRVDVVPT